MRRLIMTGIAALAMGCALGGYSSTPAYERNVQTGRYTIGDLTVTVDESPDYTRFVSTRSATNDRVLFVDLGKNGTADMAYHNGREMDLAEAQNAYSSIMSAVRRQQTLDRMFENNR